MRTRFSDLVFPIGEIRQLLAPFTVVPPTDPTSLTVCGQLPLTSRASLTLALALPCSHLPTLASRWAPPTGPASRRPSEPLFHHAVSKRPDYQLYTIMRPRLCHGGRQVSLHRRRL